MNDFFGNLLRRASLVGPLLSLVAIANVARGQCTGDLDANGRVTIDELLAGVQRLLADDETGGLFGIDGLIRAVDNALTGCGQVWSCTAGAMWQPWIRAWPDSSVVETTSGTNGAFTDLCGRHGHLIQYRCAIETHCKRDPINWRCTHLETGAVEPHLVDCPECVNGTCPSLRCPHASDVLRYVEISPDRTLFENESDRRQYDCVIHPDPLSGVCRGTPAVGDRERIAYLWVHDEYCVDSRFGYITLANGCPYVCGVALR